MVVGILGRIVSPPRGDYNMGTLTGSHQYEDYKESPGFMVCGMHKKRVRIVLNILLLQYFVNI